MNTTNAHFKKIDYWKQNKCSTLEDVLDLARCLEDICFKVMHNWHVSEEESKPTLQTMQNSPEYDLTIPNPSLKAKTGWIAAQMPLPLIATMVDSSKWGNWHFDVSTGGGSYALECYCDDNLIDGNMFLRCSSDLYKSGESDNKPWIYLKMPYPQVRSIGGVMARSSLSGLKEYNDLVRDMARSLRASCQLLSADNFRRCLYVQGAIDINNSQIGNDERDSLCNMLYKAANVIDMGAALNKNTDKFIESLDKCKTNLAPLAEYAKRFTIHLIGHSHIDLAWRWRWPETIECMKGTLENQLELMDKYSEYVFVESSAVVWKAIAEKYPKLWEKCRQACQRGQLEPVGAMWCEPDGQCLGAESWVRQILYGQKAARELCGVESKCGFNIDAFGFNAALPKIYKEAGVEVFVTQKLRYNEFNIFPYTHFWWQADDGSRILGLHIYPDHCHQIDPDGLPEFARIVHMTSGLFNIPILFGYGNHGGGPLPEMMDRIEHLKTLTVYPNLKYSSMENYINVIKHYEHQTIGRLPIIKDELFLETHHKTYTIQGKVKQADRECERQLLAAEALSTIAIENGGENLTQLLENSWQKELFNQFHDILTGTSFPSVYQDVFEDYAEAFKQIDTAKNIAGNKLLGRGDKSYVFNPLAWRRDAIVKLSAENCEAKGIIADSRGNQTLYQKTFDGKDIVFIAKDLPGLGFETYHVTSGASLDNSPIDSSDNWVENKFFKAGFDINRGVINSLVIDGVELVNEGIGRLDFLEDTCVRDYKTWNMGLTGKEFKPECTSFEKIEEGPVRVVYRAKYNFGLWQKKKEYMSPILWHTPGLEHPTSFFTQDFFIYADTNRIECVLNADWWEDDIVLKVAADTALRNTRAFYAIPFGAIERPTKRETPWEKARFEVPANTWGDLCTKDTGLAILNRSRHGYDVLGGRLRLTLLASPRGDDRNSVSDPLADRGKHKIEYAFYPHKGNYKTGGMHKYATEYECPATVLQGSEKISVPLGKDMLTVDPQKLIVTAVKPSEDGYGFIVRLFEPYGKQVDTEIIGELSNRSVGVVDLLEREVEGNNFKLGPHKILTLKFKKKGESRRDPKGYKPVT